MTTKSLGQLTLDMILKTGSYTEPLDKATRQTKTQMKEIETSASSAGDIISKSLKGLGIGISLNEIRKYSDSWTDLNSRVRLAVGPMGDANSVMKELEGIARNTYSSLEGSAEGYLLNASALTELGYSTQQQLQFTQALAAGLVASGAKSERAASVTNALSKAIAEGVLRGDNWNTVFQTGGEVADALAASLGVSRAELDKMARSGELTANKVVPALIDQMGNLQAKADLMGATVGDAFLQLDNAALKVFGTLAEGSKASGLTAAAILKLADNLEVVVDVALIAAAVMGARLTSSAFESAKAFIQQARATQESSAAHYLAMDAATRRAFVEKKLAVESLNAARASLAAAVGDKAVEEATKRVVIAKELAANSMQKYNKTLAASSAANALASKTSRMLSATLSIMGGPVGALFLASSAITYFALSSKSGADSAIEMSQSVNLLTDSLNDLNKAQAGRALVEIQPLLKGAQDEARTLGARVEYLNKQIKKFPSNASIKVWNDELAVASGKWSDASDKVKKYLEQIGVLQSVMGKTDSTEPPVSAEFLKQSDALQKQIALLGKTAEAEKLLFEIQSGALAGKLSQEEQEKLLALAKQYDQLNANAEAAKKYADEEKKAADTVAKFIENARETSLMFQAQLDGSDKLGKSRQELIAFESKLSDIRNKETLTALDKEFIAQEEITRAQLEKNAALEDEVKSRKAAVELAEYGGNLSEQLDSYQQQYRIQLGMFSLSAKQQQMELERLEINRDITRQKKEALNDLQSGDIDNDQYKQQIEMLDSHLSERLGLFDAYYSQLSERESDWAAGAADAWAEYSDNAKDIAGQVQDIFSSAFTGLEDSLFEFIKTGELSFRDLMASITEDVIRMLIRIGIQKMANFAIDKLFGTTAAAGYVASITGQATAMNFMAGLNAFASTAAIPVVGPALAPGAMVAALSISSPLAVGAIAAASSSLAGMAHSGLDYIPNEGTWLLDKGERVLSPRQNEDLTRFLAATDQTSGSAMAKESDNGRKVELSFNFSAMDNGQLMEMLMENRGALAGMVSSAFEDQGIRLAG